MEKDIREISLSWSNLSDSFRYANLVKSLSPCLPYIQRNIIPTGPSHSQLERARTSVSPRADWSVEELNARAHQLRANR